MKAKLWRRHPGLGGQDGIGIPGANGTTLWYTAERARELIDALTEGIAALDPGTHVSEAGD